MWQGIAEGCHFLLGFLPLMALGVLAAQLLLDLGWLQRVARLARPIQKWGSLPPECGASFLTAFLSPSTANAMLGQLHQAGRLDRRQVTAAALANTFPGTIMHWRTGLPLALPLLGWYGLLYYLVTTLAAMIKLATVLIWSRHRASSPLGNAPPARQGTVFGERRGRWEAVGHSCRVAARTIWRISRTVVPVTFAVYLLLNADWPEPLKQEAAKAGRWLDLLGLSPPLAAVVAARMVSSVGAFSLAGSLLSAGQASGRDLVLALSLGNLLEALPGLRYMVPYYLGLFGRNLGDESFSCLWA